jgi:hypothetical protein
MGTLQYDHSTVEIPMDDRTLAHVRVVVMAKLRRHESFALTWEDAAGASGGWHSVWIHPAASMHFSFVGGRSPRINALWVQQLMDSANSAGGLALTREPISASTPQSSEGPAPLRAGKA